MGVSISLNGRDITPGWRSMMYQLILDEFGTGSPYLDKSDIPSLERLRDEQRRGSEDPPFDYSEEIAGCFNVIIEAIEKTGTAAIRSEF